MFSSHLHKHVLAPVCTKHANMKSPKQRVHRKGIKWTTAISRDTPIHSLLFHSEWLLLGGLIQVADSLKAERGQTKCRSELHLYSTSHCIQQTLCSWEQMHSCAYSSTVSWPVCGNSLTRSAQCGSLTQCTKHRALHVYRDKSAFSSVSQLVYMKQISMDNLKLSSWNSGAHNWTTSKTIFLIRFNQKNNQNFWFVLKEMINFHLDRLVSVHVFLLFFSTKLGNDWSKFTLKFTFTVSVSYVGTDCKPLRSKQEVTVW